MRISIDSEKEGKVIAYLTQLVAKQNAYFNLPGAEMSESTQVSRGSDAATAH